MVAASSLISLLTSPVPASEVLSSRCRRIPATPLSGGLPLVAPAKSSLDGPSGVVTAKSPFTDGSLFAGLVLEAVGEAPFLPPRFRGDAPLPKLLVEARHGLRLLPCQADPLL